jgi:hypothetical protein
MFDGMEAGTHVECDDLVPAFIGEFLDAVDVLDAGIVY